MTVTGQDSDQWLTAAECAEQTGLTVRALRVYEARGLVSPRRTGKNWRLYGPTEITRLNEILTLKELGLGLSRIAELLAGRAVNLAQVLAAQEAALNEVRVHAENSLALIANAKQQLAGGSSITVAQLARIVKETRMSGSPSSTAWRRYEQARPREAVEIDPKLYADYEGFYHLDPGIIEVRYKDGRFLSQITGQPEIELFPESDTSFFFKIVPAQVSFRRDSNGHVDCLIIHQNGYDHEAARIDDAAVEALRRDLEKRVRKQLSRPGGASLVRQIVEQHQRGQPDNGMMTQQLADAVREQLSIAQPLIISKGPLRDVTFKGVAEDGWDVYELQFESGHLEIRFVQRSDGKLSGLFMRPVP